MHACAFKKDTYKLSIKYYCVVIIRKHVTTIIIIAFFIIMYKNFENNKADGLLFFSLQHHSGI